MVCVCDGASSDVLEQIKSYFLAGFSYTEILTFLGVCHGVNISKRHLNRLLRKLGLFRRHNKSSINSVLQFLRKSLNGSEKCVGYRWMHQLLRMNGCTVDRETIRHSLKFLDPEGVNLRKSHRLLHRVYLSHGPNYLWHIDGYDKLKPFGFALHAAIDGYSRKILWLRVASTNNDPAVVATYYLEMVSKLNAVPRCLRADRGSENVVIGGMQQFFRRNHTDGCAGKDSFVYGSSTRNQRIEAWCSILKRSNPGHFPD